MVEKFGWWEPLRIGKDGWSSELASVDSLLKHLGRKSRSIASRGDYCYILWMLCSKIKANPDELLLRARENPEAVASLVQALTDNYNSHGSNRYANIIIQVVKTFFKVNKIELDLHGYYESARSRRRPEYIPSLKEALRMAEVAGSLRNRLMILLLIYTGFRNSTLRALVYNEAYLNDPLLQEYTIKKELERGEEYLILIVHEVMKKRIPDACKNRIFYYTFIPPKVTECLRLYLQDRQKKYGIILDDLDNQPILNTENRKITLRQRLKTPISRRELEDIVKKLAQRAGIKHWKDVYPHCLRKTYESFLRNQPEEVKLDVKEAVFFYGHILPGSQDTYFDKTKIEEMRAKYSRMIFEPIAGVKTEEYVISEDELQTFLQQGWHFEATLPSGKIVISRKNIIKQLEQTKTSTRSQFSPDAGFEKGNPSELKQFAPQITDHQKNQDLRKSKQHYLETYDAPLEAKQSLNLKGNLTCVLSSSSSCVVKQKRRVSKKESQNRPRSSRQKKLSYFLNYSV